MGQDELLIYLKEEMDFACELWQELDPESKTIEFRQYLLIQITNTIFGRRAQPEVMRKAQEYFQSLNFTINE